MHNDPCDNYDGAFDSVHYDDKQRNRKMRKAKKKISKSDFVRSFKTGTPAKDIEIAAKKKGIKLSARYIYVIRSSDKTKNKRRGPGLKKTNGSGDAQLRSAIAELGLARSRQVLAEVEQAFA